MTNETYSSPELKENEKIQELKQQWDKTILEILEAKLKAEKKELPSGLNSEQSARLLEKSTEPNLERKKGKNQFIILSGPSASGKGTIGKSLENYNFTRLPRTTTREKRPEEQEGKDYFFVTPKKFKEAAEAGEFFPFVKTHGNLRATSKKKFGELVEAGQRFYIRKR